MTVRERKARDGKSQLFIDIRYRTADGRKHRFRRDAQIQTKGAARAEERRLMAQLQNSGTLEILEREEDEPEVPKSTFSDAVRHFRKTHLKTLKPSTRATYEDRLTRLLVPRFGTLALEGITGDTLATLDAELVKDELSASSRRNAHIVFRSVVRVAVDAGLLDAMPKFPKLPKVGRRIPHSMHREDLEAILRARS
jgi:hypothetical protein